MRNAVNKTVTLREGYTTGTCAAGAAKGAAFGFTKGFIPDYVEINTPVNRSVKLKILEKQIGWNFAECCVKKDAGDDPDVTHGALICCRIQNVASSCQNHKTKARDTKSYTSDHGYGSLIQVEGGKGVGVVTKPGLQVEIGRPAINPVPEMMIKKAVCEVFGKVPFNVKVIISVPDGEKIAERTFNHRLGINGGISIIGTTGFVKPMSEDAIKVSLKCELEIAKAVGFDSIVMVPGNLGENAVKKAFNLKNEQIVLMSNFVGFMLKEAQNLGFKKVVLGGHPGKLAKLIRGDFNTHSSASKPANDIIIEFLRKEKVEKEVLEFLTESTTVEGIIQGIKKINKLDIFDNIAEKIATSASDFLENKLETGVVLFDMGKEVVGLSLNAGKWMEKKKLKGIEELRN